MPPARLLAILNSRLAAHPDCGGMRLGGRRWETAERAGGCNWPETCLVVRVHGTTAPGAWAGLREVIAGVRAEFDLLLPPT